MSAVLAAIDFSDMTRGVAEAARTWARQLRAPLYLIHVEAPEPDFVGYEPGPQHVRDGVAQDVLAHHAAMAALRDRLGEEGLEVHGLVIQGPTVEKIVSEARRLHAAVIVTGSHGHGAVYRLLVGSTTEGILREAPCPVLVIPATRD